MSTPIDDPDDPRLTAYALGEPSSVAERQAVEQLLATSPAARAAVEQTRALARLLEENFARENAAYQEAHPPMAIPANVIPFPAPAARRWKNVVVLAGTVAALLVALGTLVLPAIRRTPPPVSVATVHPPAPPAAKESPLPPADPSGTPADTRPLLAAASEPEARGGVAESADKARDSDADRAAEMRVQSDQLAAARPGSGRAAPPAAAAPMAPGAPSPDSRAAAATVRVQLRDGTFVGGVLLTADGRVFTDREISGAEKSLPVMVTLADERQFPADATNTGAPLTARRLRIKAAGLPHVRLASERPASGSALEVARINERDGTFSFVRTRVGEAGEQTAAGGMALVFNAAGELLANEPALSFAKAAASSRATVRRDEAAPLPVRPFTAAERAALLGLEK